MTQQNKSTENWEEKQDWEDEAQKIAKLLNEVSVTGYWGTWLKLRVFIRTILSQRDEELIGKLIPYLTHDDDCVRILYLSKECSCGLNDTVNLIKERNKVNPKIYIFTKEVRVWGVEAGDYYNEKLHMYKGGEKKLLEEGIIEEEERNKK